MVYVCNTHWRRLGASFWGRGRRVKDSPEILEGISEVWGEHSPPRGPWIKAYGHWCRICCFSPSQSLSL